MALALAVQRPDAVSGVTAWHRDRADLPGIPETRLPLGRRPLYAVWERGLGPGVRADVVLCPTPLAPPRRGTPQVVVVHDAVPWTHPETLHPRGVAWHRRTVEKAGRQADLVVVPTHAVAAELARHVDLPRVRVIGEGVSADLALPADADDRADRLALPERFVLTVATLEPRKNLGGLVEAMRGSGVPLLCAGPQGWGGQDVTALAAAAGVEVRVLGRVSDADLAVLLDRATLLAVPSLSEGFGLPLLEGMAAGTPVLTTDAPALVEVAGGAALSVPVDELADGLRRLLGDDALRARLALAGPQRARRHTWQGAARELWDAVDEVHARSRPRA